MHFKNHIYLFILFLQMALCNMQYVGLIVIPYFTYIQWLCDFCFCSKYTIYNKFHIEPGPRFLCKWLMLMIFQECFKLIFMVTEQMVQNQNESDRSFPRTGLWLLFSTWPPLDAVQRLFSRIAFSHFHRISSPLDSIFTPCVSHPLIREHEARTGLCL